MFANAKGVLVCPKITKGGFILGVESGDCVLSKGAPKPIYYGTSALKGGLLVGISWYSMILVLNTDAAVAKFTSGSANGRWAWMRRWPWPRWALAALSIRPI